MVVVVQSTVVQSTEVTVDLPEESPDFEEALYAALGSAEWTTEDTLGITWEVSD